VCCAQAPFFIFVSSHALTNNTNTIYTVYPMSQSDKPVLTYFNGRGRAEVARLIFAEAKAEYVDNRVGDHTPLQASGKLPFNQLPVLEHNGVVLAQSMAIARYLAKLYGLYGNSALEGALADMIVDGVADLSGARNAAKTDDEKAKFEKEILPKWLGYFENLLKKNDSNGFFVGHNITYADIVFFNAIDNTVRLYPHATDSFPLVKAHYAQIGSRPNIAKWVKSRPETPF